MSQNEETVSPIQFREVLTRLNASLEERACSAEDLVLQEFISQVLGAAKRLALAEPRLQAKALSRVSGILSDAAGQFLSLETQTASELRIWAGLLACRFEEEVRKEGVK